MKKTSEKKLAQKREYYAKNKEMMQERSRRWRATYPERRREMNKRYYYKKTPATINQIKRQTERNKTEEYRQYLKLHYWVRKNLGTPPFCIKCKKFHAKCHWANISREYKFDLKDWVRLCPSCHRKYDLNKITI